MVKNHFELNPYTIVDTRFSSLYSFFMAIMPRVPSSEPLPKFLSNATIQCCLPQRRFVHEHCRPALEIRTKKLGAKVPPTLKSWAPHSKVGGQVREFDRASLAKYTNFAIFLRLRVKFQWIMSASAGGASEIFNIIYGKPAI